MFIKMLGIFFIMSACTFCGFTFKFKHSQRIFELENLLICLSVLEREMTLNIKSISEAFNEVTLYASKYNAKLFNSVIKEINNHSGKSLTEIWNDVVMKIKTDKNLYTAQDVDILKDFGILLGSGNTDTQKNNIDSLKTSLESLINSAKDKNNKVNLSTKIGVYSGIILIVLLF